MMPSVHDFTDEQKEKIVDNINQIKEYLQEMQGEIHEPIKTYIGDGHYDLHVGKHDIYVCHYSNKERWHINKDKIERHWYDRFSPLGIDYDIRDNISIAFYLVYHWETTKEKLLREIKWKQEDRERINNSIYNFKA